MEVFKIHANEVLMVSIRDVADVDFWTSANVAAYRSGWRHFFKKIRISAEIT